MKTTYKCSTRQVLIADKVVVKLSRCDFGREQNRREWMLWDELKGTVFAKYLREVLSYASDFSWIVCRRVFWNDWEQEDGPCTDLRVLVMKLLFNLGDTYCGDEVPNVVHLPDGTIKIIDPGVICDS